MDACRHVLSIEILKMFYTVSDMVTSPSLHIRITWTALKTYFSSGDQLCHRLPKKF